MASCLLVAPVTASAGALATETVAVLERAAFFARAGDVDRQLAITNHTPVEGRDCLLGFLLGSHFHKSESLGSARSAVLYTGDGDDRAGLSEHLSNCVFGGVEREVSHIQLHIHVSLLV